MTRTDPFEKRGSQNGRSLARFLPRRSRFVDLLAGILLPIGLLLADPIVFKSFAPGGGTLYGALRAGVYVATLWFVAMLSWWLVARRGPGFFAGTLAAGSALALAVGSSLFTLSVSVIFLGGLGLLGLLPFAIAVVYASRTAEAWKASTRGSAAALAAVMGFAAPVFVAGAAQVQTTRAMAQALAEIRADDVHVRERGLSRLRWLRWIGDPDALRRAYEEEEDADRKQRLADGYLEVTGVSIDEGID